MSTSFRVSRLPVLLSLSLRGRKYERFWKQGCVNVRNTSQNVWSLESYYYVSSISSLFPDVIHPIVFFYNNCPISHALIGWFLSSIRGQTDKIWKLGPARAALCKWATCTRQTCLSKTLFIPGIWPISGLVIVKNKLTSGFYASVLLSRIIFIITLSKFAAEPLACRSWLHSHFDNVWTQFVFDKRTDA